MINGARFAFHDLAPGEESFRDAVLNGLGRARKAIPCKFFYDARGSALFEAICRLPWYRITRTERRLLALHAQAIVSRTGRVSDVVELGPGCGDKLVTVLSAHARVDLTAHLVDVAPAALDAATRALAVHPELRVEQYQGTYEAGLAAFARRVRSSAPAMVLCLGSNIGNFDPPDADAFLQGIRRALAPGDWLLVGADLVKPEAELLLAYDDPLGVTASFNRNLLVRANRELAADFALEQFARRAVWNADASRVEMHLVSLTRQRVRVPAAGVDITFADGETIWTESSYKYDPAAIVAMLDRAGFSTGEQWIADGFALTLAEAR